MLFCSSFQQTIFCLLLTSPLPSETCEILVGRDIFIDLTTSNGMAAVFLLCNFASTPKNYWATSHNNSFSSETIWWKDDSPRFPPIAALSCPKPQNSGFPVEWLWDEMWKQEDLCCRTHDSVQRNFPKSIRSAVWLLPKTKTQGVHP